MGAFLSGVGPSWEVVSFMVVISLWGVSGLGG
jgi:hypothetical protein